MQIQNGYDLVVVGAGIIGLAAAHQAVERGLKVAVVERNARCIGASIRNFGFVTVTGQRRGEHWARARKTRDIWLKVASAAGIDVIHQGLYVTAQRAEAVDVLDAFLLTEMGDSCRWLSRSEREGLLPFVTNAREILHSSLECRVESKEAIPRLAAWLQAAHGVDFYWKTAVTGIDLPQVHTSKGSIQTKYCIVCPGHDLHSLFPDLLSAAGIRMSTLQMLRVRPEHEIRLPGAIMSDLSLVRYEGYSALPESQPLLARIEAEQPEHLRQGVHLIVVQSADGSLVVGDSHVYDETESPFASDALDGLIMQEFHEVLRLPSAKIVERWTGTYATANDVVYQASPAPGLVIGIVTGGTGASTSFAFADELVQAALA